MGKLNRHIELKRKMIVLHLIGSSFSEFYFHCSVMYARSLLTSGYDAVKNNENIFVAVHTDGRWSFPSNLYKDMTYIRKYNTQQALDIIMELDPDVMVQHIQCEMKYKYNALFEILNIPYIGADSHVSANIVDKGITRGILESAGLPVPEGVVMVDGDEDAKYHGSFPAVVKPTHMENSVGVEMVHDAEEMKEVLEKTWALYGNTAVVDKFIAGREVRCGTVELEPGVITPLGCIEYKVSRQHLLLFHFFMESLDKLRQDPYL